MAESAIPKSRPRFRRRKILIRPGYQLQVAATVLLFIIGYSLLLGILIFYPLQQEFAASATQEQQFWIAHQVLELHKRFWPSVMVVGILVAIQSIFVTHRVVGPAYHLQRILGNLTAGRYEARVHLRRRDRLRELETAVNALGENLLKREQVAREQGVRLQAAVRDLRTALPAVALPGPVEQALNQLDGLLLDHAGTIRAGKGWSGSGAPPI
jgi:HAMP domain-containing protein